MLFPRRRRAVRESASKLPTREQLDWLQEILIDKFKATDIKIQQPPLADASFRAYVRTKHSAGTHILMYFPPDKEDGGKIIDTSKFLLKHKIRIPNLFAYDLDLGTVLQEDMGEELLSDRNDSKAGPDMQLYHRAFAQLDLIQDLNVKRRFGIYGTAEMLADLRLFNEWFVTKWLKCASKINLDALNAFYADLVRELASAPSCCVHFDYHSRNLCILPPQSKSKDAKEDIAILDYQDICHGHFCYDAWSLLRDVYVDLPAAMRDELFEGFVQRAKKKFSVSPDYIKLQYHLIGLHRCLRVCGVFSRLYIRDGKQEYRRHLTLLFIHMLDAIDHLIDNVTYTRISNLNLAARNILQTLRVARKELNPRGR